jgi:hypothetical protein
MKKRNQARLVLILIVVAVVGFVWRFENPRGNVKSKALGDKSSHIAGPGWNRGPLDSVAAYIGAYRTTIEFHGKVVNQHGKPVAGAEVTLSPFDNPHEDDEDGSSSTILRSDGVGRFSISGLKGVALGVRVAKTGYLHWSDVGPHKPASSRLIEYAYDGTGGARFKNPAMPTIFTLHEVGPIEPMVYVKRKRWKLPVNGEPVRIALDSADGRGPHQVEFRFTSGWSKLPMDNEINSKKFDWRLSARIPGGGFLPNDSDYNFEAPAEGYQESLEIDYPATMPEGQWKGLSHRRLFVKFADGTYGRIQFSIDGGSDRKPLYMVSWMSLNPGSRNLASPDKDASGVPGE